MPLVKDNDKHYIRSGIVFYTSKLKGLGDTILKEGKPVNSFTLNKKNI